MEPWPEGRDSRTNPQLLCRTSAFTSEKGRIGLIRGYKLKCLEEPKRDRGEKQVGWGGGVCVGPVNPSPA